jgi:ParB family chromosome partitioning protein
MIRNIAIGRLQLSARNVRRACDPRADLELKADIEAHGLLQNLVVTPSRKPRGFFSVEAGGRRLRALQSLVEEGKVGPSHEVCCHVIDRRSDAVEVSLAENFQRLAMNPADECLAFGQLVEQGEDVEGIAHRFGLTVRFVEGRLRLASLAPVVFGALGAGEISIDMAKAYAATPDRERQAYVFEQVKSHFGSAHPDSIRRMMTQETASGTDRRARFVGEEAYVAAGGRIERDLFADDAATRWLDVALLERLAGEKLEALAAEKAAEAGLAWVRPTLEAWVGRAQTEGLQRLRVETAPYTEAEQVRLETLDDELQAANAVLEDEDAGEQAQAEAEARVQAIEAEMEAIADKSPALEGLKAEAGAFLVIDESGQAILDEDYFVELGTESARARANDGGEQGSGVPGAAAPPRASSLSQRLVDELAIQRRDILAVHVASNAAFARDLATFLMIDRKPGYARQTGSTLRAPAPSDPVAGFETPGAAAIVGLVKAADALDGNWTDGATAAERFDRFRALPEPARDAWLAFAVAATLEASLNLEGLKACPFHDHLGQLLGIDVARWWRPTGVNYFDRIPKALALAALAEVGGEALAGRHSGLRKAELAQTCERFFAGEAIVETEVKAAALAWVPDAMRFAEGKPPTSGEPVSGDPVDDPAGGPGEKPDPAGTVGPLAEAA